MAFPEAHIALVARKDETGGWWLTIKDRDDRELRTIPLPAFRNFYEDGLNHVALHLTAWGLAYLGAAAWMDRADGEGWEATVYEAGFPQR